METPENGANQPQESILEDVFDISQYDKKVRQAQNTIFIVAAIQLVVGLFMAFTGTEELRNIQIGTAVFISALFFGLGLWCKSRPFTAIIIALCLYGGLLVLDALFDPLSLLKGIIVKVGIIIYLANGIGAAKAAKDIKNIMGK